MTKKILTEAEARADEYTQIGHALVTFGSKTAPNIMAEYNPDELNPPELAKYFEREWIARAAEFMAALTEWAEEYRPPCPCRHCPDCPGHA